MIMIITIIMTMNMMIDEDIHDHNLMEVHLHSSMAWKL